VKFRGNIKISAIFRGATVQWPPLCPDHENFLQATLYEKVRFFAIFQQELQNSTRFDGLLRFQISEKLANLWFQSNIQKQKVFQLHTLAMAPPLPNPKYATDQNSMEKGKFRASARNSTTMENCEPITNQMLCAQTVHAVHHSACCKTFLQPSAAFV